MTAKFSEIADQRTHPSSFSSVLSERRRGDVTQRTLRYGACSYDPEVAAKRLMAMSTSDRRRRTRVMFRTPVRGDAGGARIYVLDASPIGLGIEHEGELPPPGSICRLEMPSELGPIRLDCAIVRTVKRSADAAARALFRSGLEVVSADRQSEARLRSVVGLNASPDRKE